MQTAQSLAIVLFMWLEAQYYGVKERLDLCINIEGKFKSVAVEVEAKHVKRYLIVCVCQTQMNYNMLNV